MPENETLYMFLLFQITDQDAKPGRILVQAKNDQIDSDRIRVFYDKRKVSKTFLLSQKMKTVR